jgi:hypothetical protein
MTIGGALVLAFAQLAPLPDPPPPVLVVRDPSYTANPFSTYISEMLRGEGLVEHLEITRADLMQEGDEASDYLANFEVVLLAEMSLDADLRGELREYVDDGGNLIAFRPDLSDDPPPPSEDRLAPVFGLTWAATRTESLRQFFDLDTTQGAGRGIVPISMQYHGVADEYTLAGASVLGRLFNDEVTPSSRPAVTRNDFGDGHAVAFTFDPAKSVAQIRQGNPQYISWRI